VIASVAQAARGGAPEGHDAAFTTIATQALDAGKLISDLLTLARHGDAQALLREPVDLAAITARVVQDEKAATARHGLTITLHGVQSAIIDGEEARLRQLLRNLIENAREHAVSSIRVTVSVHERTAQLSVEDDGPGVEAVVRATLFNRFVRGSQSRGSGLGLAICRWVVQAHGGSIALEGNARFVARLPLGNYPQTAGVLAE
jgi:two-component system OmpR family sensor kinase